MCVAWLADQLVSYCAEMAFTHVELLPVSEHPFGGSWGYQVTSYFAPTARFGTPDEFRFRVDRLHQPQRRMPPARLPGRPEHGLRRRLRPVHPDHDRSPRQLYVHVDPPAVCLLSQWPPRRDADSARRPDRRGHPASSGTADRHLWPQDPVRGGGRDRAGQNG